MPRRFDADTWLARAAARLGRGGGWVAASQYVNDAAAIRDLARLQVWCDARRLRLFFTRGPNGTCDIATMTISINCHLRPSRQVHVLLHECGHFLIGDRQATHKVDVIDEELDAWRRGLALARRLRLELDEAEYNRTRAEYVSSYIHWLGRGNRGKATG